jgi:hypothetical protein
MYSIQVEPTAQNFKATYDYLPKGLTQRWIGRERVVKVNASLSFTLSAAM